MLRRGVPVGEAPAHHLIQREGQLPTLERAASFTVAAASNQSRYFDAAAAVSADVTFAT
jgi:hypothetical protein